MHQGAIIQFDKPDHLLHNPANDFVRELLKDAQGYVDEGNGI
jgi:ABC-type proline/glycine betaine transport system ATPase subunit